MIREYEAPADPIRLNFRSVEQVYVEPDDKDRFFITMREAALACKQAVDNKEWQEQFDVFLFRLQKWGEKHSDSVDKVIVAVGDGSLNILICTNKEVIDFDFDDEITDLDTALANEFDWLNAEMMQIPKAARGGRFPYAQALEVYGDGSRTPATS